MTLPMLGLGGFHVGQAGSEAAARALVNAAFDEGIRFFDTAESYQDGTSERWLGSALAGRRDQAFVMSKSFDFPRRRPEMAERHLEGTLRRLRISQLDLNPAEIELRLVARPCLGTRRLAQFADLSPELRAWNRRANRRKTRIRWRFTRHDARK